MKIIEPRFQEKINATYFPKSKGILIAEIPANAMNNGNEPPRYQRNRFHEENDSL